MCTCVAVQAAGDTKGVLVLMYKQQVILRVHMWSLEVLEVVIRCFISSYVSFIFLLNCLVFKFTRERQLHDQSTM